MKYAVDCGTIPEKATYPILMRSVGSANPIIVLFMNREEGMRLQDDGFDAPEGGWFPADDSRHWTPFVGTITVMP